jgi:hypothetical protein
MFHMIIKSRGCKNQDKKVVFAEILDHRLGTSRLCIRPLVSWFRK